MDDIKSQRFNPSDVYDAFDKILYYTVLDYSFSHVIPEIMLANSQNFEDELASLVRFIEVFQINDILFNGLLLLLDLNVTKYRCKNTAQMVKPILISRLNASDKTTKNIIFGVIVNNIDLFYEPQETVEFIQLLQNMIRNNSSDGKLSTVYIDWAFDQIWGSKAFIPNLIIDNSLLVNLFGDNW